MIIQVYHMNNKTDYMYQVEMEGALSPLCIFLPISGSFLHTLLEFFYIPLCPASKADEHLFDIIGFNVLCKSDKFGMIIAYIHVWKVINTLSTRPEQEQHT
jgi:hypothetical protein